MKTTNKRYEAPRVEVIEIEYQGILCASAGGDTATGPGGNGFKFGNNTGNW